MLFCNFETWNNLKYIIFMLKQVSTLRMDELRSFTSHKYILSGKKVFFLLSFPLNGEEATGNEWETMRAGFKLGSPAHKHYCATRQSTFTNHWAMSLTFCMIFYRKCILVPVTMSLHAHLWQTAQVMVSLAAPVSLCETAPVIKMWKHIVI